MFTTFHGHDHLHQPPTNQWKWLDGGRDHRSSETCISPALAIARQFLPKLYLITAKEYSDLVKLRQFLAKFCLRRQKDIFSFNIFYSMTLTWQSLPHHLEKVGQPLAKVFSQLALSPLHLARPRLE